MKLVIKDFINAFKESAEEFLQKNFSLNQKILIDVKKCPLATYELEEWIKIVGDEEPIIVGMFIYLEVKFL